MRLSNDLDKCAGQLEVKLLDSWWSMSSDGWSKKNSDMVCQHLECGALEENSQHRFVKSNSRLLDWKLACKSSHISNCSLKKKKYNKNDAVVNIICNSMGFRILDFIFVYIWNVVHGSTAGSVDVSHLQGP